MKSLAIVALLVSLGTNWYNKPETQEYIHTQINEAISSGRLKRIPQPLYARLGIKPVVFESTAYEAGPRSCGYWARFGRTRTGIRPYRGVVAIDPRIIKFHTKMYVEGYGYAIAEDTGGAIKGHRIDLFMPTVHECLKWGRRKVKVYILPKGEG